ncbi:cytochrome P450 family protein [Rhizoctonia solani]|uniref:Cytochrome P450 family protein n=1 Tax=Rhizoctonia solani TaxID=456999 RepID=A0A8H8P600_9AGAM|nr:cytochrome P450 family protein [Rhizoctonia solani]QRW25885.1 cytochrome P450 family protein [Rhizoctonia solani]
MRNFGDSEVVSSHSVINSPTRQQDDEYRGYRIPANSTVYNNVYAITRDESMFPDPEKFIPERFDERQKTCGPLSPRDIIFGIGRRVCPGQFIADTSIFLVMSGILATMDITKARDGMVMRLSQRSYGAQPSCANYDLSSAQLVPVKECD